MKPQKRRNIFCLLFLTATAFVCRAELPHFSRFDKITQHDGLSSNHVLCILQEKAGWMWFGTNLGLNRYDGYDFTIYGSGSNLCGELVRCIYEDNNNQIWIGTEHGGLNLFHRETETFSHFLFKTPDVSTTFSVNCIVRDESNRLWIGSNKGLAFLNDNRRLELFPIPLLEQAGNPEITEIFFDRKNNLWIGTLAGLFVYDFSKKECEWKPLPETSRPADEIHSLFSDSDNILWIGTYHSGVYRANVSTKIVKRVDNWVAFDRSETVRDIKEDNQGILWFGTRGGLVSFDKTTQTYNSFLRDEENDLSLSLNSILSLCVDNKGDLWIGTRAGINYRNINKQAFIHLYALHKDSRFLNNNEIYCFCLNRDHLLIGTESGGVNIYDIATRRFRYLTTSQGLSSDCVKSFVIDGDEILIGTFQGGITIVDAKTYRVKTVLRNRASDPNSLPDDIVWSLLKDRRGNIWTATNRGVALYDNVKRSFYNRTDIFPQKLCYWIKEDETGDLWMGGDELHIYNPETQKVITYDERTRDVIAASNGHYWIATRGRGLALYDKAAGAIKYLTETDGLPNNTLLSLQRDKKGYLWISTLNGLSRFDEKNEQFINFDTGDGLQDNQFNYGAAASCNDQLIYGGINGVTIFNPSEIRKNFFVPPVVFTGLKIFNKPAEIGSAIRKSINVADCIELKYKQNVFSIEFAALSYTNPQKNAYAYMLEGFDNDWIYAGTTHSATYTNLYPGEYFFRVKASNANGIWNTQDSVIRILIHPSFWQTWWFRSIMALLLLSLLFYLANFYLKRAKLKNELVFEKVRTRKLHEIESLKLRFFVNISHEIRTPLTLILGPLSQVIEQNNIDPDAKNKLLLVKRNADQLLNLVNQLLDFRKLESGKQSIHYEKSDIVFFIQSIVDSFHNLAAEKGISLSFSSEADHFFTWFDSDKIRKIINNLLSNALKFTPASGAVTILFEVDDVSAGNMPDRQPCYTIIVKDTGRGIARHNIEKIFERFEQLNGEQPSSGTGIGLAITKEFIKLMNGEINIDSTIGKGADFIVRLPLIDDPEVEYEKGAERSDSKRFAENRKILLLVEDNDEVREFTASNFRSEYQVLEAKNGKEGYEQAIEFVPDMIISDFLMPVLCGDALCKKLKKDERTSHIPFILLTAINSVDTEKELLKAGVDDYITKPFDVNILKLKVDNLLTLRDTLRERYRTDFLLRPTPVTLVSPDERFLKKAIDIVEKNMNDPDFDIETFAVEIGVSRMQLYRKVKALTNMTVKEYIRNIRIKRAAQLLEQNKMTISEIVYKVGFVDIPYFRKCFRSEYGCTPSEYAARFK
jgi:signal transduction histidine kinase/ligand-binding sensor domain-containing protein/DNA-binding response OmpR family regulator